MRILNPISAWALAGSLLAAAGAHAQSGITPATPDRPASAPVGGRNAFIAPVIDIRIQDQGLALPKGLEEPPIALPVPAAPRAEEALLTAPPADAKDAPPATAK